MLSPPLGLDRQCVNTVRYLILKRLVDGAMHLEPRHSCESLRDNADTEMGFAFRPGAGMPLVPLRLVHHFQAERSERVRQGARDALLR